MDQRQACLVNTAEPPSWALVIQDKLIKPQAADAPGHPPPPPPPPPNPPLYQPPSQSFTHYIRRLTAQLDSEQYSDGEEHVAWEKGRHVRNHKDSFEVR